MNSISTKVSRQTMRIPTNWFTLLRTVAVALSLWFLQPLGAAAGTMTMYDGRPELGVEGFILVDMRGSTTDCTHPEQCRVFIVPPPSASYATFRNINILDSNRSRVSDTIAANNVHFPTLITFTSDPEGGGLPPLPNARTVVEDGTIQEAGTITWHITGGGTVVDTIFFVSDVEDGECVPHPGAPYFLYSGGVKDTFASPPDPAYPSPALLAFMTCAGGPILNYDVPMINARFGDSFCLQENRTVCKAELRYRVRSTGDNPSNDVLNLMHANGGCAAPTIVATILTPLLNGSYVHTLTATEIGNLNTLLGSGVPGAGTLDIYLEDDTEIDYVTLQVWYNNY